MIHIRCHNPQQGHASIAANLWPWVKAQTMAGNAVDIRAGYIAKHKALENA